MLLQKGAFEGSAHLQLLSALRIFTSGQGLDLVAYKAWHLHDFVLLTSVGMLIMQESYIA